MATTLRLNDEACMILRDLLDDEINTRLNLADGGDAESEGPWHVHMAEVAGSLYKRITGEEHEELSRRRELARLEAWLA